MASEQPPSPPPSEPAPTTITGLGGDLLREIFLLLPSPQASCARPSRAAPSWTPSARPPPSAAASASCTRSRSWASSSTRTARPSLPSRPSAAGTTRTDGPPSGAATSSSPASPTPQSGEHEHWLTDGRTVDGFIYWVYSDEDAMLVLDTTTLHFSRVDFPDYLKGLTSMFRVGKTRDGVLCCVVAIEFNLYVWLREVRDDGVEEWVRGQLFQLDDIVEETGGTLEEHGQLKVLSVVDGVVYFSTHETFEDASLPCWFLSIDLEEYNMDLLFQRNYDSRIHAYIMPWPRSLVRNKACLQVEGA